MWETSSIWFDFFVISAFMMIGHILFGHFEERTPRWRKLLKAAVVIALFTVLSATIGRLATYLIYGALLIPVVVIHGFVLPRKGINGWTGEPKARYYEFRGWSTDIFGPFEKVTDAPRDNETPRDTVPHNIEASRDGRKDIQSGSSTS